MNGACQICHMFGKHKLTCPNRYNRQQVAVAKLTTKSCATCARANCELVTSPADCGRWTNTDDDSCELEGDGQLDRISQIIIESKRAALRNAIVGAMGPDPHSGGAPHPDTVDAITDGVLARIAVNNARPAKYADEPWREQTIDWHSSHACGHTDNVWMCVRYGRRPWLSDLGQPEAAHAGLRMDFLLWRHGKYGG